MSYYIKRSGKVNGPFTDGQIKSGIKTGKLKNADLISTSENGPWKTIEQAVKSGRPAEASVPIPDDSGQVHELEVIEYDELQPLADDGLTLPVDTSSPTELSTAYWQRQVPAQPQKTGQQKKAKSKEKMFGDGELRLLIGIGGGVCLLIAVLVVGGVFLGPKIVNSIRSANERAMAEARDSNPPASNESSNGSTGQSVLGGIVSGIAGVEIKKFELEAGTATFTINRNGLDHLKVEFNSGLVADVEWEENPLNLDFGYDIYEPEVSQTTNRLALMLHLRGIIVNYLNGEYD